MKKLAARIVPEELLEVQYIPSERPLLDSARAQLIRRQFGIGEHELVFGRIGRSDDSIFDPIGILGFEIALQVNPNIHYIIMSPALAAKQVLLMCVSDKVKAATGWLILMIGVKSKHPLLSVTSRL